MTSMVIFIIKFFIMKFPAAPVSTRAVKTTPVGQPVSQMGTRKGLVENDDNGILTPTLGDGRSQGRPSDAPDTTEAGAPPGRNRDRAPAVSGDASLPQRVCTPFLHGFRLCLRQPKEVGE
jgi:hypothetical protein